MNKPRARGFTLVELLMAISITAMVGLVVTGASVALSSAYSRGEDSYECLQTARAAMRHLRREFEKTPLVFDTFSGGAVLAYWGGDSNGNRQIDVTEVRLTTFDQATGEIAIHQVVYPDDWSQFLKDAYDPEFALSQAMSSNTLASWVMNSSYRQSRVIATAVESCTFSLPGDGPVSKLVRVGLTARKGACETTLQDAGALRAPVVQYVSKVGGVYVLTIPE